MSRVRHVPTTMRSAPHVVRALQSLGFKQVESHTTAQPLQSWRGKDLEVAAEIIVRRGAIGSTADDLGFARTRDGTFEGIVTAIHFYRFEQRWFADLAKLYEAELAADGGRESAPPTWIEPPPVVLPEAKPQYTRPPVSSERSPPPNHGSKPQASSAPTRAPLAIPTRTPGVAPTRADERSRVEVGVQAVMARIQRENRMVGVGGCLAVFAVWFMVAAGAVAAGEYSIAAFATFGAVVISNTLAKKRLKHVAGAAAEEFRMHFHRSIADREEAVKALEGLLDRADAKTKVHLSALLTRLRVGR